MSRRSIYAVSTGCSGPNSSNPKREFVACSLNKRHVWLGQLPSTSKHTLSGPFTGILVATKPSTLAWISWYNKADSKFGQVSCSRFSFLFAGTATASEMRRGGALLINLTTDTTNWGGWLRKCENGLHSLPDHQSRTVEQSTYRRPTDILLYNRRLRMAFSSTISTTHIPSCQLSLENTHESTIAMKLPETYG